MAKSLQPTVNKRIIFLGILLTMCVILITLVYRNVQPMMKFDLNLPLANALIAFHKSNNRFPMNEDEFIEWLKETDNRIEFKLLQRNDVNWNVDKEEFLSGNQKLILKVENDSAIGSDINRFIQLRIKEDMVNQTRKESNP